ncbi:MAG: murein biosynthesis integral membrane protein MurJ [Verrucomicrobiales bacterium]
MSPPPSNPPPAPDAADEKPAGARATGVVAVAILGSRILGLVRDMVFSALFTKELRDCFLVAFRIPNMLRDLFAEGALSTAFVTVFSQKLKTEGDGAAWQLAHRIISLAAVFMSAVSLAGILLADPFVTLLASGWRNDPAKLELTILLTRIMFPFILLVSLAALVMGILNSKKIYGVPATASSFFNLVSIVGGVGLGWLLDPAWGPRALMGFSFGTLLGGLAQLTFQLPSLRRCGYRFRFSRDWSDSGVRRILSLMWPAVIAGSAVQVNVFLNTIFASSLAVKDGPVSWLSNAFRLMQLPLGVFGVAVATVTLPVLSRVATEGITPRFREVLGAGNRLVIFLTLPSALGLYLLAEPVISLIYEHGRFTAEETHATALALRWYAVGLVFYSCIKVIQPAFTAIDRRFIPMVVALVSIGLNAALNSVFVFVFKLGHEYLALSTAVIACTNCLALYGVLARIAGGLDTGKLFATLARLVPSLLALALVAVAGNHWLLADWDHFTLPRRAVLLLALIGTAGAAYFGIAILLHVGEARQFFDIVRRKFKR